MRQVNCNKCDKRNIPLNETIKIDNITYCKDCFETNFPDENDLTNRNVVKEFDPTICSFCEKDFGSDELKKISIYPICENCEKELKNKNFPLWVKAFFIGIIIIVIASFIWNWKYYEAYSYVQESYKQIGLADYEQGANYMKKASDIVPELEDLKILYNYYNGLNLLSKNENSEAIDELNKCVDKLPEDFQVNFFITQAKIGYSFDEKDYDGFLKAALEMLDFDSTIAVSNACVASAYACIYAEKGADSSKKSAYLYLDKAKKIDDSTTDMNQYYNMIEYRIYSKNIIKSEDFLKQFPKGWTKK